MNLTEEQKKIVLAPSGNILVSAAAGSGKTSVMTERIVKRILDRELSVEHVLVMTFTNAAAANMSAKLEKRLREKLAETKDKETRKYLSEQIAFLPMAYISTINAFCSRVISNFSAQGRNEKGELMLEPKSSILDETHSKKLLQDAFSEVFSEAYSYANKIKEDPDLASSLMPRMDGDHLIGTIVSDDLTSGKWAESFLSMVASFGSGRDDTSLKEDMEDKLAYLRSLPNYDKWIADALTRKRKDCEDFSSSKTYKQIFSVTRKVLEKHVEVIPKLLALIPDVIFVKKAKDNEVRRRDFQEWCTYLLESGKKILEDPDISWDDICELGKHAPDVDLPGYRMSAEPSLIEFNSMEDSFYVLAYVLAGKKKTASWAREIQKETRYFFGKTYAEITSEMQEMYLLYERYFEIVFAADKVYRHKKALEHGMDFPDQEQVALTLLSNPEVSGYYRDLFDEIYIDEYQDNSGVQDAIVQCFSKGNVFFVGVVKQSIYRFRHAKPLMFLDRSEKYRDGREGTLYTLNSNFRSVPGILSVVNEIFSTIMSEEYADIEYDETHALHPGLPKEKYIETSGAAVTLILATNEQADSGPEMEKEDGESESDGDPLLDMKEAEKVQKEALIVAEKIGELKKLEGFSYEQCVILTRSNRGAMAAADILMKCGIPAQGPNLDNILMHPDLRVMLDLARLTDNILQDIPLAGVMKSEIRQADFSDDDLFKIYLFSNTKERRDLPFCEKVIIYAKEAETHLAGKLRDFLSFINDLRTLAMQMTVTKWLEHVYATTDYPAWVRSQNDGDARYYALMSLVSWAGQFDAGRRQGLRSFVGYIDELDEQKDTTTEIDLAEPLENVVRCMTIHKSKGLEFPYVFLCGIQSENRATNTNLILSETGEMAAKRFVEPWGLSYEPHDYYFLSGEEARELDAEKIRLLYVALTRAEKKVFVISLVKRDKNDAVSEIKNVESAAAVPSGKLPAEVMVNLRTHLQKFTAGETRLAGYPILQAASSGEPVYFGDIDFTQDIRLEDSGDAALISDSFSNMIEIPKLPDRDLKKEYEAARNRRVDVTFSEEKKEQLDLLNRDVQDWAPLELMPSKTTVSEMKRILAAEETEEDEENIDARAVNMRVRESEEKWKGNGYSASQLGTLLHSAWQYIDFSGLLHEGGSTDWESVLQLLSNHGMITKDQIEILKPFTGCMQAFLESDLASRMIKAETRAEHGPYREIPFALAWPNEKDDFSLVQGMIDCWFVDEDGEAVLIDYKSDRLDGSPEEKQTELEKRYKVQLDMYAQAITAATGKKVKEKIIWLIRDGISFVL